MSPSFIIILCGHDRHYNCDCHNKIGQWYLYVSKLHGYPLSSPSTTKPSQHHLKQFIIAGIQKTIINTVIIIEVYES